MTLNLFCELFAAEMLGLHIYSGKENRGGGEISHRSDSDESREGKREAGWLTSYM